MQDKFVYFLNAIHYCIWLNDRAFGDFMGKIVDVILSPIPKYLFTEAYRKKCEERLAKEQKNIDKFFYDKEVGFHISWANHWFGYFYSGYPILISFILGGLILRNFGYISNIVKLIILAVPIGLCYIPAYKAVFTNDRYLKYHKQFEKEDERWHRKWKRITLAFCIGSIFTSLLGICAIWIILLL